MDGVEEVADFAERVADGVEGSCCAFSQHGLELREGPLDRVEIGRVWRQWQQPGAALAHQFCRPLALVESDVVEDHDIARSEFGRELGFDVDFEADPVHRPVDDPWRDHAMASETGDESLRLPAAERRMSAVALTFRGPAAALGQPCVGGGFVDEDEAAQGLGEEGLAPLGPKLARLTDIGALLFAGLKRLFL